MERKDKEWKGRIKNGKGEWKGWIKNLKEG